MRWSSLHRVLAVVLATNYFAFQVELFEDENEANHPKRAESTSFTAPSLNWESFDKDNAPQAFVVDPNIQVDFLFLFFTQPFNELLFNPQYQPVRDKSPPIL
jgi:hypothetical protein